MAESKEELKNPLMKVKGEWKTWLKTKTMASGTITSCQIDGEKMETVTDFIFLGSKITAYGDTAMKLKNTSSLEEKLWQTKTAY